MRRIAFITLLIALAVGLLLAQSGNKSAETGPAGSVPVPKVAGLPPAAEQAMAAVDPEKIRAHVKFLASDLLEGRGTGARGGDIAAEYIATQFALYGLKPAGDNGTFMQKVPMVGIATQDDTTFTLVPDNGEPMNLHNRADFVAMDETTNPQDEVDAPIVWMGYGIDAPEFNWNDYKDADVKGKVLLMMVNQPPSDDPKFFNGRNADLLRPLDLQVRRGSSQGRDWRHSDSQDRHGQLRLERGAQFVVRRACLSARRSGAQAEGGIMDSARGRTKTRAGMRHESRRHDGRGAEARLQGGAAAGQAEGSHDQQGAAV